MTTKGITAIILYSLILLVVVILSTMAVGETLGTLLGIILGVVLSVGAILFKPFREWLENFASKNIGFDRLRNPSEEDKRVIREIYYQILERKPDDKGLSHYGLRLQNQEDTVKDIVQEIGKSNEYFERFVRNTGSPENAVRYFYKHFLAREPEQEIISEHVSMLNKNGKDSWKLIVEKLVNSDEYRERFGEHSVPK